MLIYTTKAHKLITITPVCGILAQFFKEKLNINIVKVT